MQYDKTADLVKKWLVTTLHCCVHHMVPSVRKCVKIETSDGTVEYRHVGLEIKKIQKLS